MSSVFSTVCTGSCVVCIIRLRWKLPVISFLFVQTLKALNWNYSLKCRGLIKRTFLDLYSSKLRIFCLPKHRTKSPPMVGPHTNVGTWAPSYLATLLVLLFVNNITSRTCIFFYLKIMYFIEDILT